MINKVAEFLYNTWAGWIVHIFAVSTFNKGGSITIPKYYVDRWGSQIEGYSDLPKEYENLALEFLISVEEELEKGTSIFN
jgi:hypothetical protein